VIYVYVFRHYQLSAMHRRVQLTISIPFLYFLSSFPLSPLYNTTMPPSRQQTQSHTSHKPPYPKHRYVNGNLPPRHSSTGSTGATGLVEAAANSSPGKKPVNTQERNIGENEEGKIDKKRRKKARKERESNVDVGMAANVKAEDQEVKEEKVVKARPLVPHAIIQAQVDTRNAQNQTPSQHHAPSHLAPKHGITNNALQPNKAESRANKLEQKVEKQKIKLKEAEARAAEEAERSRKDAEKIKDLEESVKELKNALEVKEQAAEGVQGVVNEHLAVSCLFHDESVANGRPSRNT